MVLRNLRDCGHQMLNIQHSPFKAFNKYGRFLFACFCKFFFFLFIRRTLETKDNKKLTYHPTILRETQSPVGEYPSSSFSICVNKLVCMLSNFLFYGYGILLWITSLASPIPPLTMFCEYISISLAIILQHHFNCWWHFIVWMYHSIWEASNI